MVVRYIKMSSGGKGNRDMFKERSITQRQICAAGLATAQPKETVQNSLQYYRKCDELDAVMSDAIFPPPKPLYLPDSRHVPSRDMRHATGMYTESAQLITPPNKTKFQTLATDLRETVYSSYWKKQIGSVPDPATTLPAGLDPINTTFGKKTPFCGRLYDVIMPKEPYVETSPLNTETAKSRKYCSSYNLDLVYGIRSHDKLDRSSVRCCLTDDSINKTAGQYCVIRRSLADNKVDPARTKAGPMPQNFTYGKVDDSQRPGQTEECLVYNKIKSEKYSVRKCLAHLNTVRAALSKRSYLPSFFQTICLNLKYYDINHSGWIPKKLVYDLFRTTYITFDVDLIEPLLCMWNMFDGEKIAYEKFIGVLNYRLPIPTIPKIPDIEENCLDYATTYSLAMNPDPREVIECAKVERAGFCIPVSDIRPCLNRSMLSYFVDASDMYAKRDPQTVRRVFEAAGEKYTDDTFNQIWNKAKTYHSQGWVCFETFRRALNSGNLR